MLNGIVAALQNDLIRIVQRTDGSDAVRIQNQGIVNGEAVQAVRRKGIAGTVPDLNIQLRTAEVEFAVGRKSERVERIFIRGFFADMCRGNNFPVVYVKTAQNVEHLGNNGIGIAAVGCAAAENTGVGEVHPKIPVDGINHLYSGRPFFKCGNNLRDRSQTGDIFGVIAGDEKLKLFVCRIEFHEMKVLLSVEGVGRQFVMNAGDSGVWLAAFGGFFPADVIDHFLRRCLAAEHFPLVAVWCAEQVFGKIVQCCQRCRIASAGNHQFFVYDGDDILIVSKRGKNLLGFGSVHVADQNFVGGEIFFLPNKIVALFFRLCAAYHVAEHGTECLHLFLQGGGCFLTADQQIIGGILLIEDRYGGRILLFHGGVPVAGCQREQKDQDQK